MTELDHINSEIKHVEDTEAYFGRLSDTDKAYLDCLQQRKSAVESEPWKYEDILKREG